MTKLKITWGLWQGGKSFNVFSGQELQPKGAIKSSTTPTKISAIKMGGWQNILL